MKHSYTGRYTVLIRFMHLLLCSQARNYVKGVYTPAMHVQLIRFIIQRSQHNTVSYEYNNYIIGCCYTPTLHLILRFIIQRMDEDKSTWHCMCTHFRFFFLIATWSGVSPFLFNMLSITNMLCLSVWPSVLPKHLKGNTTCTKRCTSYDNCWLRLAVSYVLWWLSQIFNWITLNNSEFPSSAALCARVLSSFSSISLTISAWFKSRTAYVIML